MMLKRYLIFTGVQYEENGGFFDYTGSEDVLEDAIKIADAYVTAASDYKWAHVVDCTTGKIVHNV